LTCPSCGSPNEPGRKFCGECGTPLARVCANCGSPNGASVRFCGECGHQMGIATEPVRGEPFPAAGIAPGPVHEGHRPSAPVTERRLVSVLFADLVGFTARSEGSDPEEVREFLSRYFELARETIERYGGTVEKFIGDAVMAVWGTPVALEDDAERAVRAGLDLVDAVRRLGRSAGDDGLELRAGVLTGEAAVTIGATGQGMVAGDLVNTASRLQSVAPPGTVLVGEATHHAASRSILFEPAGEQQLKGKAAPVEAWRALRVVAERGGQGRSEGVEAPFTGRDDELRLLKDMYHAAAREGRTRLVSITGIAGIGKSRLSWEFLKYIDGLKETVRWHQGRSPSYGEGVTFWALGEMIRRRAKLVEGDDEVTTRARIAETLADFVPDESERHWIEPSLLFLLGVGDAPAGGRDELFAAWRTFFERIAATGTTLLVFEDLQWADTGLLDFIDHLLDWSRNHPILVVTLARPELLDRRPDWGAGRRNLVAISLEPLPEPAMRSLLGGLVPGLREAAMRSILGRAGGVPLYAVETIRMLVADGRLEAADGAYRVVGELGELEVPGSLQALIAARLDALDPADRALLQDASVLGQTFSTSALSALSGEPTATLEPQLRSLARRELLTLDADPRSPERGMYGFTQALIREVAYGTLALADRRTRHLAAARYFESLGDDELAGVLATHYLAAHAASPQGPAAEAVATQARIALKAAADRAAALGSHDQAVSYLEQALTVASDEAEGAALLEQAGRSADAAGRHADATRLLDDALQRQRALGDLRAVARVTAALASAHLTNFDLDAGGAVLEPAAAEFADLSTPESVAVAGQVARYWFFREDLERTLEAAEVALAAAERLDLTLVIADVLVTKGSALGFVGRTYEGLGALEAGRRLADARDYVRVSLRAQINLANILAYRDPAAGLGTAKAGYEVALRYGMRTDSIYLAGNATLAALRTGDWGWIVDHLSDAAIGDVEPFDRAMALTYRSPVSAFRGDPTDDIEAVAALIATIPDPQAGADLDRARAYAALAAGDGVRAFEHGIASGEASTTNGPAPFALAARGALWARDVERARTAHDRFAGLGYHGPAIALDDRTLNAGIMALEGRPAEALVLYREVWRGWREIGCAFDLALSELDAIQLLGADEPDLRTAADEARAILEGLRARPLLERLAAATGGLATGGTATSEPTAARPVGRASREPAVDSASRARHP
jgi:class 3 adenylate cyclase/tetratricopeptide (TPR) repeat protein